MANPTPVLPLVGSMIVPPGRNCPLASAPWTMARPIRSFTEPPGFRYSTLARTVGASPRPSRDNRTIGVSPTASRIDSYTRISRPFHGLSRSRFRDCSAGPGRPDGGVHGPVPRSAKRAAVLVDSGEQVALGPGRAQRVARLRQPFANLHLGGDLGLADLLAALLGLLVPALQPLGVGALETALDRAVVQQLHAAPRERGEVVELQRLKGIPRLWVSFRVADRVEGGHGDLMGAEVVGMRVAAALVVGEHDLRPLLADDPDEPPDRLVEIGVDEGVGMPVGLGVGHAGVAIPEEVVLADVEDLQRLGQLLAAEVRHAREVAR